MCVEKIDRNEYENYSHFMHYLTESKKRIFNLFASNPTSSFTLGNIMDELTDIPKSTVYRIVDDLEEDRKIRKVALTARRSVSYQFYDAMNCPNHMHIRCTECGKTVHVDRETSEKIEGIIESSLGFSDCLGTIFKGKCPECARKEKMECRF